MNTKNIFILSLLTLGAWGCKSIKVTDLQVKNPNSTLLPQLEPMIDLNSFQTAYSKGSVKSLTKSAGIGGSIGGTGLIGGSVVSAGMATSYGDKRIQDAMVLYEREIRTNVTMGTDKPMGQAICRITTGETKAGGIGWTILSSVTCGVPNLFGMPVKNFKTELELEVEIKDSCNRTVGRYTGYGFNKTFVAAYWGYGGEPHSGSGSEAAARKSNIEAFSMAMQDIKSKILVDYEKLKMALGGCKR